MNHQPYKAIAFDVFGMFIEIKHSRSPYKNMMKWLKQQGRTTQPNDVETIMSIYSNFEMISGVLGYQLPTTLLAKMNIDPQHDIQQMQIFDDSVPTLIQLKI